MRVASNKLKDLVAFYHTELAGVYDKAEIEAMAAMAIEHYLGYTATEMITKLDSNINQSQLIKLYDCCKALKTHQPLQYILGEAWFYNLKFMVNPHVLIPRPETEELVDIILKENPNAASFFDIGTGSGCIPVTIKHHVSQSRVEACDISHQALLVATQNAQRYNAPIIFAEADVLDVTHFAHKIKNSFDVIVSNPPYIKQTEAGSMAPNVREHEPSLALFVNGNDDIIFYKKIIDLCANRLNAKGRLYFELNPLTAEEVKQYALQSNLFAQVELIKDMSGALRFLKASRP